jgi:hypothetical protein
MTSARALARSAVADWLSDGNIIGVDKVHLVWPLRLDFNAYSATMHRCQLVVVLESEGEVRVALGGAHSGKKRIDYLTTVEVYHSSITTDPADALANFDEVVDGIKTRLRADRMAGQTDDSIVWQMGEGGYGIQTEFMIPDNWQVGGEPIEFYARIRFEVTQWITS